MTNQDIQRTVVIAGGTSGIGLATAQGLAAEGTNVAVIGTDEQKMRNAVVTIEAIARPGTKVMGLVADVRNKESLAEAAGRIEKYLGPVTGLVASAGIANAFKAEDLPLDALEAVFSVNVYGVLSFCQAFVKPMIERQRGSIVIIGSINSLGGQPGRSHYTASKHAVVGLVKNLAIEWGRFNVRVNGVAPGPVDTPLLRRNVPETFMREIFEDRIPLGRLARAEEIAFPIMMLLAEGATYINGAMLTVDGGMTAGPFTRRRGADLGSNKLLNAGVYTEV
jgi:NAD(P)-dependent dehydrogenase (short-subunit alcohol dehydrogenase family)